MESLQEAAELLHRLSGGIHRFRIEKGKKPGLDALFFAGLLDGTLRTDRSASAFLFADDTCPGRYRTFKSRFCEKLEEALLTVEIDRQKFSDITAFTLACVRKAVMVRLFYSFGKGAAALTAVRETLAIAEKYHIIDLQTDMLGHLQHDAQQRGDMNEFEIITAKRRAALHTAAAAMETEEEFLRIATAASRHSVVPPEAATRATEAVRTLEERYRTVESYGYRIALFRLKLYVHSITGNHEAAIECCNDAEKYYGKYPQFASPVRLAEVYYRRMSESILCGKTADAKNDARRASFLLREGSQNWYNFMMNYFELCMQMLDFTEAASALARLDNYARAKNMRPAVRERVRLYKGYLWYCHHSGWAEQTVKDIIPNLRLPARTKVDYTFSQEDKQGANFALVVLDYLIYLQKGDAIGLSEDAFKQYEFRYLNETPTRAGTFMKLLRLLLQENVGYTEVATAAAPLVAELASLPRLLDAGEILPFEHLWEHILSRRYYVRREVV